MRRTSSTAGPGRSLTVALFALALALVSALARPGTARADEPSGDGPPAAPSRNVAWRPSWAKTRVSEYVLVPALGATMLGVGLAAPGEREPAWTGRNGFDDGLRDGLRGRTPGMRSFAATTSDVLYVSLTLYPPVVESLVLSGLVHREKDTAWQLFMIYGESALTSGVLTVLAQGLGGRGRPLVEECATDPGYDPMCGSRQQSRSFFAGHVAMSMNSAALVCVNQAHLDLYGSRAGGIVACAATMTLATTTGVLRVVADKHWTTDVLTGAAVGLSTGLLYPLLLHYGFGGSSGADAAQGFSLTPVVTGGTTGFVASFTR